MWPTGYMGPLGGGPPLPGEKFPIPRLSEGTAGASILGPPARPQRRHVSRACEFCRQRKTKCSGEPSGCINCQEAGIICCYTDSKKEKSKRQMNTLEAKIRAYEKALKVVGDWNGMSVDDILGLAQSEEFSAKEDASANPSRSSKTTVVPPIRPITGPSRILDYTAVDFNRDDTTRSTGYIGRSSEIHWMHALDREITSSKNKEGDSNASTQADPHDSDKSIASFNYNLDHLEITRIDGIERLAIPSKTICWNLFDLYRTSVHPLFPIVGLVPFTQQLESFLNRDLQPSNRWLAILHLILAIASRYTFVTNRQWNYDQVDHFSHFLKVKALSIDGQVLNHPDMQQLQIEGLASFYLLAMGYVNRSWFLCGSALRRAFAIGLHLRNLEGCTRDSREIRYRVWWSLYTLESRLCVMTGRLSTVPDNVVTIPLLIPFDECDFQKEEVQSLLARSTPSPRPPLLSTETSTNATDSSGESKKNSPGPSHVYPCNSLYFIQLVKLTFITKKMSNKLYNPESVPSLWASLKYAMRDLMLELEGWLMNLPKFYDFSSPTNTSALATERMTLALVFYSTKLTITKPFLGPSDPYERLQKEDREFSKKHAADCVESACHIIRLLPEPPDTGALYTLFPWWSIIHFLMQATVVLLIEASLGFEHIPQKVPMVLRAIKKSLEWMSIMSKTSATSDNAQRLCEYFLERLDIKVDLEASETPEPSRLESESDNSPSAGEGSSQRRRVTFQDQITELDDTPLILHAYQSRLSASARTMGVSATTAMLDPMDIDKPTTYAYADELLPYDQNTGLFTDTIFPPVDPTLESNLDYPPDPML
ncbi:hypothetical protein P170DRAFT_475199 [Aspergillus steynii IBT 23096]|uniref:Zn(2)-C6 fungal-type domain-containing protein n=1 Tax=Aspergillus steynii IBT 23096 TaxID=1392250 RepID=A0A2I2G7M1_9EURO|nr:uncharacterized protein P170DRAFT_475199 [Aspergillus steynii IBT 23096]PLB48868.1 hypothetical protein P170DRAFT_475199 [Aspergillus steynii IBT 23096]